jgi:hypothetical protein
MHNVLPFLLLGIGIDDMFVIVQVTNSQISHFGEEKVLLQSFSHKVRI